MEQVSELPAARHGGRERTSKYDALFKQVMNGQVWKLQRGEDFDIKLDSFYGVANNWAKKHGYQLRTRREGDNVLYIQANPMVS